MIELQLEIAGQCLVADSARVLAWPAQRALLVADLHLGKAQVFRQAGLSMPEGSDEHDLRRLADAVARHSAERLFLLGDIVHGATTIDATWRHAWQRFASAHGQLEMVAIIGNHDRHDRDALVGTASLSNGFALGPFDLRHHPIDSGATDPSARSFVIAGHLHPLAVVSDSGRDYRLPCFWLQPSQLVLPAFGSTTRGQPAKAGPGDRIIAITPAGLHEVTRTRAVRAGPRRG